MGDAARAFRHLLTLLPLEQRGLTEELVRERRALRQLDQDFFRYYMAALDERRSTEKVPARFRMSADTRVASLRRAISDHDHRNA